MSQTELAFFTRPDAESTMPGMPTPRVPRHPHDASASRTSPAMASSVPS